MPSSTHEILLNHIEQIIADGPFAASWNSLDAYKVPQWYQDAKFGIFIHWGVYSVPAFGNEWYPRNMYKRGRKEFDHHLSTYGSQANFGYKDFIPQFKAQHFDAASWARLFKKTGARFVMPVAEHHDGFAMYDTALSRWCATNMGPRRDILGEISKAVRDAGMIFTASSHRAEHWWFFDEGMKIDSDVRDSQFLDLYGPAQPHPADHHSVDSPEQPDEAFLIDWLIRTCEWVERYRPQIVWFDWWIQHLAFKPYLQKFAAFYYNLAAKWDLEVAINYKYEAFKDGTAVLDIERGQLRGIRSQLWQNDTSVSKNSWGYIQNHDYKTVASILQDLIDVVSKNGALLLNIGPTADGLIPQIEQQMLLEIGDWLTINGQAIYETHPWKIFGEGPTQTIEGSYTDAHQPAFTHQDIRFTAKGKIIYAFVFAAPPDGQVEIKSFARNKNWVDAEIKSVSILGWQEQIPFNCTTELFRVSIPQDLTLRFPICLKIATQS